MTVVANDDQVLIVSPPGESAVLSVDEARLLGRALDRAAAVNALAATVRTTSPITSRARNG